MPALSADTEVARASRQCDTPATSCPWCPHSECKHANESQSHTRTHASALPVTHNIPHSPPSPPRAASWAGWTNSRDVIRSLCPISAPHIHTPSGSNSRTSFLVAYATSDEVRVAHQSHALLEYQLAAGGSSCEFCLPAMVSPFLIYQ